MKTLDPVITDRDENAIKVALGPVERLVTDPSLRTSTAVVRWTKASDALRIAFGQRNALSQENERLHKIIHKLETLQEENGKVLDQMRGGIQNLLELGLVRKLLHWDAEKDE